MSHAIDHTTIGTIADLWGSYELRVVPPNALPVQRRETRRAFYAGFKAMLDMSYLAGERSQDVAVAIILDYEKECRAFVERELTEAGIR
jgi:hypothetical protein